MEIYLIVFILFDNYDLTFIYVCMCFVCYQNKQDTLAGECFPVSNRTNTFDIVQLDTVSLFNLSFQRRPQTGIIYFCVNVGQTLTKSVKVVFTLSEFPNQSPSK